jgi:ribonuclease-3
MPLVNPLETLQSRLGYVFKDARLLQRAITHRSHGADHYERLEFLGDAVLGLGVSALLYRRFERSTEGDLTRVRAHLVRQDTLHKLALDLGLPEVLRLSEGEARGGGAQRPSILADALEALLGAIYLEAGFDVATGLVQALFQPLVAETALDSWGKDSKTALQEWLQGRKLNVPTYRVVATHGKSHEQTFDVACEVDALGVSTLGQGASRRAAEQIAAQLALEAVMALPASSLPGGARPKVVVKKARTAKAPPKAAT